MSSNNFKVFIVLYNDYCSNEFGPPAAEDKFIAAGQTVEQALANAKNVDPQLLRLPIAYSIEDAFKLCRKHLEYISVLEKTYAS